MSMLRRFQSARLALAAVFVLLAVILPACRPAAAQPPRSSTTLQRNYPAPSRPLSLLGQIVFSPGDGSVWVQAAGGASIRPVVKRSGETFAESPIFSLDGKQIVYSTRAFTKDGNTIQDIRTNNLDGTNERVIASPPDTKTMYILPSWSPDGKDILYTRATDPSTDQHDEVYGVSAAGGAPRKLIEDSRGASLSPDGQKMAFVRYEYKTARSSLWIARADGARLCSARRARPKSRCLACRAAKRTKETLPSCQPCRLATA